MVVQIWCKDVDSTFCLSHPLAQNKDVTKNNQPLGSEWAKEDRQKMKIQFVILLYKQNRMRINKLINYIIIQSCS